ncbi:PEPxxWA-CTERM sorting domain-containing protein [Leptothrix discophora]|uniref:PEPxxWA-CTERM sorting domain-containing protein n=1 Tax=Leptothrix discophora TaxID=89 RepID=A0ABT9G817_LEPDI|nr:PEPxxWA-CTERM sorting domain-containing protein [Leptothrix discophora]MDP4302629.1 PEPxxWA-CTERM sorting domain-containing protein [Leptothrix discophora]
MSLSQNSNTGGAARPRAADARVFQTPLGLAGQEERERRKRRLMLFWLLAGLLAAGTLGYGLMKRSHGVGAGPVASGGAVGGAVSGGGGAGLGAPLVQGPAGQEPVVAQAAPRAVRAAAPRPARDAQAPARQDRVAGRQPPPQEDPGELVIDPPGAGAPQVFAQLDEGSSGPVTDGGGFGSPTPLDLDGNDGFARRAQTTPTGITGPIGGLGGGGSTPNPPGTPNTPTTPTTQPAAPVTAVPEPETWALMLAGLTVVGWQARRRRAVRPAATP